MPSAFEALRANKSRSVLTTLGIVIGVVAVIVIVGLGQGSTAQVTSQISNLGTNVLTIMSGSTSSSGIRGGAGTQTTLKAEDSRGDRGAGRRASPRSARRSRAAPRSSPAARTGQPVSRASSRPTSRSRTGRSPQGGFFPRTTTRLRKNVAVIGQTVATNLFPNGASPVGQQIRIRNVPFTVVGVLAPKGSGMGGDQDDTILIPFQAGQMRLFGATSVNSILVQAGERGPDDPDHRRDHGAPADPPQARRTAQPNDFTIRNNSDLLSTSPASARR